MEANIGGRHATERSLREWRQYLNESDSVKVKLRSCGVCLGQRTQRSTSETLW